MQFVRTARAAASARGGPQLTLRSLAASAGHGPKTYPMIHSEHRFPPELGGSPIHSRPACRPRGKHPFSPTPCREFFFMRSDRPKMAENATSRFQMFRIDTKIGVEIGYLQNKYYFCLLKIRIVCPDVFRARRPKPAPKSGPMEGRICECGPRLRVTCRRIGFAYGEENASVRVIS